MTLGTGVYLNATVSPSNATNPEVSWSSSDPSIASVNAYGHVSALETGVATITVTTEDGGKTATCEVTVKAATVSVSGVSLNKSSLYLTEGDSETLTATVSPSNATNKNVSWKSSNTSVATVSSSGKVTAVKAGSASITVTTEGGGKTATCSVTVNAAAVDPSKAADLSSSGTANCYIVSTSGDYKFKTVKGNTTTSVGSVSSASVVWETFGTATAPNVGDLVNTANYSNGYITFRATGKEGNALIAAKDASGNILWSWHIWCTDKPSDQVYKNNAGTLMDRNLGATSATPGDVGALGLLYQWGRKDPFLGSSSISSSTKAKSTITWPSPVASNSSNGTIAYATSHPTTFITRNENNQDWYYTGSSSTDDTRWSSDKGTYDPCPPGYRVPDGGNNGVWSKALGSSSWFNDGPWNSTNKGMDFKSYFTSSTQCWYPASGFLLNDGSLDNVGNYGYYQSCTPKSNNAYILGFFTNGNVRPSYEGSRSSGKSVRCIKEGSMSSDISVSSVSLNKSSLTLTEGDTETLTATVSPSNATNKNVSWKSSNTSVATVSSSGKVTAVKAGSATITVTTADGGKTATCEVKVKSPCPDGAVDLGLSVYWASCNLGATKPEEYGGYYQWGGTQDVRSTSISLNWDNCPYHTGSSYETGWTKYVPSGKSSYWSGSGSPDNKTVLDPDDDVAHVKLGGNWRMPTIAEFEELQNTGNCTWEWTTLNGVNGYKVTSKKSGYTGNWIFLPAAGDRRGTGLNGVGSIGLYCSSSLHTDCPHGACGLCSDSDLVYTSINLRYLGQSVRPVLE